MYKKASKGDITFFKGVALVKIHDKLVLDESPISIDELEDLLKHLSGLTGVSCSDMSHEEMQWLKERSKKFAMDIGLDIDKNNGIHLNF